MKTERILTILALLFLSGLAAVVTWTAYRINEIWYAMFAGAIVAAILLIMLAGLAVLFEKPKPSST